VVWRCRDQRVEVACEYLETMDQDQGSQDSSRSFSLVETSHLDHHQMQADEVEGRGRCGLTV
jgi:hypothetical protein